MEVMQSDAVFSGWMLPKSASALKKHYNPSKIPGMFLFFRTTFSLFSPSQPVPGTLYSSCFDAENYTAAPNMFPSCTSEGALSQVARTRSGASRIIGNTVHQGKRCYCCFCEHWLLRSGANKNIPCVNVLLKDTNILFHVFSQGKRVSVKDIIFIAQ